MKFFLMVVCVLGVSSCAALDQYVTRRSAEFERIRAERRAEIEREAVVEYGPGTTVRHISDCEWEVCVRGGSVCISKVRDDDNDGSPTVACGGEDCRDNDPLISPNRPEACDGVDNDCSGVVDETCAPGEPLHP